MSVAALDLSLRFGGSVVIVSTVFGVCGCLDMEKDIWKKNMIIGIVEGCVASPVCKPRKVHRFGDRPWTPRKSPGKHQRRLPLSGALLWWKINYRKVVATMKLRAFVWKEPWHKRPTENRKWSPTFVKFQKNMIWHLFVQQNPTKPTLSGWCLVLANISIKISISIDNWHAQPVAGHDLSQTFWWWCVICQAQRNWESFSSVASASGLKDFLYNMELQLRSSSKFRPNASVLF